MNKMNPLLLPIENKIGGTEQKTVATVQKTAVTVQNMEGTEKNKQMNRTISTLDI